MHSRLCVVIRRMFCLLLLLWYAWPSNGGFMLRRSELTCCCCCCGGSVGHSRYGHLHLYSPTRHNLRGVPSSNGFHAFSQMRSKNWNVHRCQLRSIGDIGTRRSFGGNPCRIKLLEWNFTLFYSEWNEKWNIYETIPTKFPWLGIRLERNKYEGRSLFLRKLFIYS